jgi:DNA-3-methyladenine glycosylase
MYYCLNFTTEPGGVGAVLIRAAEPLAGLPTMARRRGTHDPKKLCSGPGKLCQALDIDLKLNGRPLGRGLKLRPKVGKPVVMTSRRIGISQAQELEWRFFEQDSPFVSRG